jgi:UDP-glucose 6-dehydrogenase
MNAIIGDGTVGRALGRAMKVKPFGPSENPVKADVVVICVPTETMANQQDLTQVNQAFSRIKKAKLVILRSTVLPGTTEALQAKTKTPIMFVPEFGFEATMVSDLEKPASYLLGMTKKSTPKEIERLARDTLPKAPKYLHMSATGAEFAKYFTNIWGCSQVILANSLYDWVMDKTGSEAAYLEAVTGAMEHKNMPKWGWRILDQGFRGAGGKCLPKDLKAAIGQYPHELWLAIDRYNERLRNV